MEGTIIYDQLYSAPQMAKLLHIETKTFYRLAKDGTIPSIKLTEKTEMRFAGWQIRAWLDSIVKEKEVKKNGSKTEGGHRNTMAL